MRWNFTLFDVASGSPFPFEVLDVDGFSVDWSAAQNTPVFNPITLNLNGRGIVHSKVSAIVTGMTAPNGVAKFYCFLSF
jgi:hypothetical protein